MPAKWFRCSDNETIEIERCLAWQGCRMDQRCATQAFLELVGFDRKWQGVSPSAAGNGPRYLYLKAATDYTVDPQDRVWAANGTNVHGKLSIHKFNRNVLSEEALSDEEMKGTADALEEDEWKAGHYILTDYKTWGSFKVAKALGIKSEKVEETVLDEGGKPVILKSGKNKGQPKTKKRTIITQDPAAVDLKAEELQLNRYRIFFEKAGFPISRMQIQFLTRDGGTYVAEGRGITQKMGLISIRRLPNDETLSFYRDLAEEVREAFKTGYARKCHLWESWERRKCEGGFCEVAEACKAMSKAHGEKWGII